MKTIDLKDDKDAKKTIKMFLNANTLERAQRFYFSLRLLKF